MDPRGPLTPFPTLSSYAKAAFLALASVVVGIYASHLQSEFHLDDIHTVVQDPWIRDLHNFPKFFTDTSSVLPLTVFSVR